jgi:hypothetical protein
VAGQLTINDSSVSAQSGSLRQLLPFKNQSRIYIVVQQESLLLVLYG